MILPLIPKQLDVIFKILQLITSILGLWKVAGADVTRRVLAENNKRVCDEACEIKSLNKSNLV